MKLTLPVHPSIPLPIRTPTLQQHRGNLYKSLSLSTPLKTSRNQQSCHPNSIKLNPESARTQIRQSSLTAKEIFKNVKSLFKSCKVNKKTVHSNPQIRMSRQQKITLNLPQSLHDFSRSHKLQEKKEQIKYANTLKRIKKTGQRLGCEIRAKSQGIELKLSKQKEERNQDLFNYTFGKQLNRLLKKRMVKQSQKCYQEAASFNCTVENNSQGIATSLRKNESQENYKGYDHRRMEAYLKGKATGKAKYPFYIKKELQSKISRIQQIQEHQAEQQDDSTVFSGEFDSPRQTSNLSKTIERKGSIDSQASPRLTHRSSRLSEYQEDILQFLEICQFYEKIQKEILRYLPNNHLANKIDTLIAQVEYGETIEKIYRKSCLDRSYFSPSRVVAILKKFEGILGTMNYIVNVIKLNVSAERRKRFKDTERSIEKYQNIIKVRNAEVCERLKKTNDVCLRKNIFNSIANSKMQASGMNPTYKQFAQHTEKEDLAKLESIRYSIIMCDILKYETIMK